MPITIKNLSYTYAPGTAYAADALSGIDLTIHDGEFVGIMGKTGCGKSTLIQLIAGLLNPTGGTVLLDEEDIFAKDYHRDKLRRTVGVVFQHPEHQLFETTVEKDVAFGLKHHNLSKEEKTQAVRQALEAVGFDYDTIKDRSPLSFSGGEKRRIAIAGVLAVRPKVLILDEPVAGLDPLGRKDFLSLLDRLHQEGTTILMISHNADAISEHTDRVIVLEQGKILYDGKTEEVLWQCEELRAHGIGVGQTAQIAEMLREKNIAITPKTVRYEDLLRQLIAYGKGCGT